tara:strand:- start:9696 stop:11477 length:1782 start_codon:yes stop_codon:yes gene_type:complete
MIKNYFSKYINLFDKRDRNYFLIIIFLAFGVVFFETLSIGLVLPALHIISSFDSGENTLKFFKFLGLEGYTKERLFIISVLALFFAYTLKAIFLTFASYKEHDYLSRIKLNLSKKLFSIYLTKPFSFHLKTNSSKLMRNLLDLRRFAAVLTSSTSIVTETTIMISVLTLLTIYEPLGTLCSLTVFGVFSFFFHKKIQRHVKKWGETRQKYESFLLKNMTNSFSAIKEIKVFGKEKEFIDNYIKDARVSIETEFKKHSFTNTLPRFWFEWITVLGMIILVFILYSYSNQMSNLIPTLGLFAAAAFRLVPSIVRIMNNLQRFKYNYPVLKTLSEEIQNSQEEVNLINSNTFGLNEKNKNINFSDKIEIKNLSFKYPNTEKKIIKNLSLSINHGSIIGIVGESGVGKTTLINLLLGLITPDEGDIAVDGDSIFKNIRGWQKNVGYVPQTITLFDDTIKKNIAFGQRENEIDNQKIARSIKESQLEKLINEVPKGFDTNIGEFGERLSGGQKQRIGIARALYTKPNILIMDESTNSLDVMTEKKIVEELFQLKGSITIIIVAHRQSIFEKCDKIFKLNPVQEKSENDQIKEVKTISS